MVINEEIMYTPENSRFPTVESELKLNHNYAPCVQFMCNIYHGFEVFNICCGPRSILMLDAKEKEKKKKKKTRSKAEIPLLNIIITQSL